MQYHDALLSWVGFHSCMLVATFWCHAWQMLLLSEAAFVAGIRRTDWTTIPVIEIKLEIAANDRMFLWISHSAGVLLALAIFIIHTETDSHIFRWVSLWYTGWSAGGVRACPSLPKHWTWCSDVIPFVVIMETLFCPCGLTTKMSLTNVLLRFACYWCCE